MPREHSGAVKCSGDATARRYITALRASLTFRGNQPRLHARLEEALQLPVDLLFVAEGAETTHFKRMICAQARPLAA